MRTFQVAVTEYTYINIPESKLEGLSDEEACDLAEEMFNNGEYSDMSDSVIEIIEC